MKKLLKKTFKTELLIRIILLLMMVQGSLTSHAQTIGIVEGLTQVTIRQGLPTPQGWPTVEFPVLMGGPGELYANRFYKFDNNNQLIDIIGVPVNYDPVSFTGWYGYCVQCTVSDFPQIYRAVTLNCLPGSVIPWKPEPYSDPTLAVETNFCTASEAWSNRLTWSDYKVPNPATGAFYINRDIKMDVNYDFANKLMQINANAKITVNSGVTMTSATSLGGTIVNNGVMNSLGSLNKVVNNGIFSPGANGVGYMYCNSYKQSATGTLNIELESTTSNDNLQFFFTPDNVLSGTLKVSLINGFVPVQNNTFKIINTGYGGTYTGTFSNVDKPPLPNGLKWQVNYKPDEVRLTIVDSSKLGGAFNFSPGAYATIPTNNFPVGNSSYTIESWVKTSDNSYNNIMFWGNANTNASNAIRLEPGGKIRNYWWANDLVVDAPPVNDGNWHHIAATFDGTTRKIYMDGMLLGSDNPTGKNTAAGTTGFLGGSGYQDAFKGTLDEVRVFNRALTQSEILATKNCEILSSTPGLSAYYKFNQGLAYQNNIIINTFDDASLNGNSCTSLASYGRVGLLNNFAEGAITNDMVCNTSSTHTTTISTCDSYTWAAPLGNGVTYTASGTYTGPTNNYVTEVLVLTINAITASAAVTSSYNGSQLSCASSTDGIITVTATGGTGTLSYSIDGGSYVSGASANVFTGLAAGVHTLSVKDANGCIKALTPVSITTPAALTSICINSNPILWFGYPGDQTDTITVKPSGGVGPYKVTITMNRPLSCNVITSTGDEVWAPQANTNASLNAYATCPTSGSSPANPSSTSTSTITSATGYSLFVTLVNDAIVTATITDANGCTTVCSTSIHAEDVRCFTGNSTKIKVTICHKTGSTKNPCVEMCVDEDKVAEHKAHGDFVGKCTIDCKAPAQKPIATQVDNVVAGKLSLKVIPNPTTNYFKLKLNSASREKITVKVLDVSGRLVDMRDNIPANSTLELGGKYNNGLYFAEVVQGTDRVVVKLLKQQ